MCDSNANLILKENNTSLWLGNQNAALDLDFLKREKISVIVNCTTHVPFIYEIQNIPTNIHLETIRIPVNDSSSESDNLIMAIDLYKILPFLYKKFRNENKNILIHCYAGVSRSASVTAAFLFYILKKENSKNIKISNKDLLHNIINYIRKKRQCTFFYGTRFNFKNALYKFIDV
jgi:protein tyrosine phosphatase